MKVNIAIELLDKNLHNVDLSQPEQGNPGIGGSEWLFLMLARYLQMYYDDEYRISIYHYGDCPLPTGVRDIHVETERELLELLKVSDEQIIVHQIAKTPEWYEKIGQMTIADIPWAHCYIKYNEVIAINQCPQVKRVVFVGKEEYDSYIDDNIVQKSTYIYNMINGEMLHKVRGDDFSKTVTYMGSLVEAKAFHLLAEIWPDVLERVPDAKLQVIGTGKLYDRDARLGRFGIAQEAYENYFMQFLTDADGNILSSVRFLGLVGQDKEDYFVDTAVGVVNPSGSDETFCLSAVEMEICGVPIVTRRKYGLLDTIAHKKTGLLFKNRNQFVDYLVMLLNDKTLNKRYGGAAPDFVKRSFEAKMLIGSWHQVFQDVVNGTSAIYHKPEGNYQNDLKWLRIINRFIRFNMRLSCIPSINHFKYLVKKVIKR